jgi:hypothetical protein
MLKILLQIIIIILINTIPAYSFVGVFLSDNGSKITTHNSRVVVARQGQKTILTFTSDFQTHVKNFILLVPVPSNIKNTQIHTVDYTLINNLETYTSPRLIEYINYDPCNPKTLQRPPIVTNQSYTTIDMDKAIGLTSKTLPTTTDHNFIILTSKESTGIDVWLQKYGYPLPTQYEHVIKQYIKDNMKFIVVEVRNHDDNVSQLAPIQIEYESEHFSIPIKIGTLNSPTGRNQDMLLFILSNEGEVSPENYKVKNMPGDVDLPISVVGQFDNFYNKFVHKIFAAHPDIIRKEYAWPINACKPCTSSPISISDLQKLGVFWYHLPEAGKVGLVAPFSAIYVTRFHTQYNPEYGEYTLANNIIFKETNNREEYQTFFNIKHPLASTQSSCKDKYYTELKKAEEQQNKNLNLLAPNLFSIYPMSQLNK